MKKILFLSTHNFATNPRLVKEIELALDNNIEVTIICFEFDNWSSSINQEIKERLSKRGAVIHAIHAGRKHFIKWMMSLVNEKLHFILLPFFKNKPGVIARAFFRRHNLIVNALHKISAPGIVVAHNPGALAACLKAADFFNCRAGFDVEDYHPGEGHNKKQQYYCRLLMMQVLPKMSYVSFASGPIKNKVETDIGKAGKPGWLLVPNYFPASEFTAPVSNIQEEKIKLVWFSQNINVERGLELVIPVLAKYSTTIELHLFGNPDQKFFNDHLKGHPFIHVHSALPQAQLHRQLSTFDIGLALEPLKDLNNDLALSNKLLAYFQAGLFIVASTTTAQSSFLKEFGEHGVLFGSQPGSFENVVINLIDSIPFIREKKTERYQQAGQHSWDTHKGKLLNAWQL